MTLGKPTFEQVWKHDPQKGPPDNTEMEQCKLPNYETGNMVYDGLGALATPVIDPARGVAYISFRTANKTWNSGTNRLDTTLHQWLEAIDATGLAMSFDSEPSQRQMQRRA